MESMTLDDLELLEAMPSEEAAATAKCTFTSIGCEFSIWWTTDQW